VSSFTDPRLDEPATAALDDAPRPPTSPLERLERDMAQTVEREPVTLSVPARPGYAVRYSTNISLDDRERWERIVAKSQRNSSDATLQIRALALFAWLMLADTCEAIMLVDDEGNAEDITTPDGSPVTFKNPWLWGVLRVGPKGTAKTVDVTDVVRAFYVSDGDIEATALKLTSSYSRDIDGLDPTES